MSESPGTPSSPLWRRVPERVGGVVSSSIDSLRTTISYVGGVLQLLLDVIARVRLGLTTRGARISGDALIRQAVRVGVRSIPISVLVQLFVGIILALNMAPTLASYGQIEAVADVVAIAIGRVDEALAAGETDQLRTIAVGAAQAVGKLIDVAGAIVHGSESTHDQSEIDRLLGN